MIEDKLFNALKSLGIKQDELANRVISTENENNEYTLINKNILITYISYPPHENRESHSHKEIRITFIRSGNALLKYEDSEIKLHPGEISVLLPGVVHSLKARGEEGLNICEIVIDPSLNK